MSTGYEAGGRTGQKQRTRELLLGAARDLVADGAAPTVEAVAARAGISRTTAYRYFSTQAQLLAAAHPEVDESSLLTDPADPDPARRLAGAVEAFTDLIVRTEAQQRTMLRLSLSESAAELPLRQGRAIRWFGEALEPLDGTLTAAQRERLALAVRACCGIESLVWLTDVAGLPRGEAVELMRWSAAALLRAALAEPPTPATPRRAPTRRRGAASRG